MSSIHSDNLPPPGFLNISFDKPSDALTWDPLSQPESDPSIALNIDVNTAINTICRLLSNDFSDSHAQWLHLTAKLTTNITNGIWHTLTTNLMAKFHGLSNPEGSSINSLNQAINTLSDFSDITVKDDDEYLFCTCCMESTLHPCSDKDWEAQLMACNSDILAACKAIIETGIRKANKEVDNCLASQVLFAHDMVINHLVSNATPSFTSLLPDP